jgi:hypothetical protein
MFVEMLAPMGEIVEKKGLVADGWLIYDFHATFDRGVKVRLFARHSACQPTMPIEHCGEKTKGAYLKWFENPDGFFCSYAMSANEGNISQTCQQLTGQERRFMHTMQVCCRS